MQVLQKPTCVTVTDTTCRGSNPMEVASHLSLEEAGICSHASHASYAGNASDAINFRIRGYVLPLHQASPQPPLGAAQTLEHSGTLLCNTWSFVPVGSSKR